MFAVKLESLLLGGASGEVDMFVEVAFAHRTAAIAAD